MSRTSSTGTKATVLAMFVGIVAALLAAFGIASATTSSQGDAPTNGVSQYGSNK